MEQLIRAIEEPLQYMSRLAVYLAKLYAADKVGTGDVMIYISMRNSHYVGFVRGRWTCL